MSENRTRTRIKKYVRVLAEFTEDGALLPLVILWEDGTKYEIDFVSDCRRAASLKAGGTGMRYTCRIRGGDHYLFYEGDNRWFVEAI